MTLNFVVNVKLEKDWENEQRRLKLAVRQTSFLAVGGALKAMFWQHQAEKGIPRNPIPHNK